MSRSESWVSSPSAPPVVLIMGPTAAGKTDLAIALAAALPLDIVSVDSAMVYRGMNIGTGKPCAQILATVPHRLVDIRDPEDPYSAADFRADALDAIAAIHAAGRIPLLVGGTGLYFRALRQGLSALPPATPALRRRITRDAERSGWPALHARLAELDPAAAARIHPHDPQRIQRALEVCLVSGTSMTELRQLSPGGAWQGPVLAIAFDPFERHRLHERIASRFEQMLAAGLIDEVRRLRERSGLQRSLPSMRAVGYRQVWAYLDGELGLAEMRRRAVAATRQLARRQLTWLRAEADVHWFGANAEDPDNLLTFLQDRLATWTSECAASKP